MDWYKQRCDQALNTLEGGLIRWRCDCRVYNFVSTGDYMVRVERGGERKDKSKDVNWERAHEAV